jgi:hypothetical protein
MQHQMLVFWKMRGLYTDLLDINDIINARVYTS